jgi:hypothetical protein
LPKDTLYGKRRYIAENGLSLAASVVLMGTDRTSIHKPEFCLLGQGWQIESRELIHIPLEKPFPCQLPAMKFTTLLQTKDKNGNPLTVKGFYIFWFVAEDLVTARHSDRVLWLARDLLTKGVLDRWAYVSYFVPFLPKDEIQAFEKTQNLIRESVPQFQTTWPKHLLRASTSQHSSPAFAPFPAPPTLVLNP